MTHPAGELAGDHAARAVDQPFGQHRSPGQVVVPRCGDGSDDRCDRRPVLGHRLVAVECRRQRSAAREERHVAGGVAVVG